MASRLACRTAADKDDDVADNDKEEAGGDGSMCSAINDNDNRNSSGTGNDNGTATARATARATVGAGTRGGGVGYLKQCDVVALLPHLRSHLAPLSGAWPFLLFNEHREQFPAAARDRAEGAPAANNSAPPTTSRAATTKLPFFCSFLQQTTTYVWAGPRGSVTGLHNDDEVTCLALGSQLPSECRRCDLIELPSFDVHSISSFDPPLCIRASHAHMRTAGACCLSFCATIKSPPRPRPRPQFRLLV